MVIDNLPVEVVRYMGADVVVAAGVEHIGRKLAPVSNIFEVLTESIEIQSSEMTQLRWISTRTRTFAPRFST